MNTHYKLAIVITPHNLLGITLQAYAVQFTSNNEHLYKYNKVYAQTAQDFQLTTNQAVKKLYELIELTQSAAVEKKFNPPTKKKPLTLQALFADKKIAELIEQNRSNWLKQCFEIIEQEQLILSLAPTENEHILAYPIQFNGNKLTPKLYFNRTNDGIEYQLKLILNNQEISLLNQPLTILVNEPAIILLNNQLHFFKNPFNAKKLIPFLSKPLIYIPKNIEQNYFTKFILPSLVHCEIEAQGFTIQEHTELTATNLVVEHNFIENSYFFSLQFTYKHVVFGWTQAKNYHMSIDSENDELIVHKTIRNQALEQQQTNLLKTLNLQFESHRISIPNQQDLYSIVQFARKNEAFLNENSISLNWENINDGKFSLAEPQLTVGVTQQNDWFDVQAVVEIESFTIPFVHFRNFILKGEPFYKLPNGNLFLIPKEWFAQYSELLLHGTIGTNGSIELSKSHFPIVQNLKNEIQQSANQGEEVVLGPPEKLENYQPTESLKATLRPYQLEGFQWITNLHAAGLGACLADDMGLGKTVQTIAALLYGKENFIEHSTANTTQNQANTLFGNLNDDIQQLNRLRALVVLPTSLIFNWLNELQKFAPSLKVLVHTGSKRTKTASSFYLYDVVLTTYNLVRIDLKWMKKVEFNYIVLDESQQIKNHKSKLFKAVNELNTRYKLSLSGTPIENSLSDLWAQMSFINPDLLGSYAFFAREYQTPIEKKNNEFKKEKLKLLISPYLLRRTKTEVAKDLPELTIKTIYSEMSEAQKSAYEKEKSAARNLILENLAELKSPKMNFLVLKSLLKLRQIANHPKLAIPNYTDESGKFDDLIYHIQSIVKSGHKVLVYSQFVTHLNLIKQALLELNIDFSYLTGTQTSEQREQAIARFKRNTSNRVFLLSLKAGGVGLNLTESEYVILADPWWNPQIELQAIARAHRIGQQQKVVALKFITKQTVEEKIIQLQDKKLQLSEEMITQFNPKSLSKEEWEFIFDE